MSRNMKAPDNGPKEMESQLTTSISCQVKLMNHDHLMVSERLHQCSGPVRGKHCCRLRVPWVVYLLSQATLIMASLMIVASYQDKDKLSETTTVAGWQVPSPHRPIPADIIVLENGSSTSVSSLEDYLSQIDQQQQQQEEIKKKEEEPKFNKTTSTLSVSSKQHGEPTSEVVGPMAGDENHNKVAALSEQQIEREEMSTTTSSSTTTTATTTTTNPSKPQHQHESAPEMKHHHDKHGGGHHNNHHHAEQSNSTGPKPILQHWQVKSLLNVTTDFPLTHSWLIYGYIWPMMAAITLFSNLMIVFVLTQQDMRTPTNVVLTAIAIADIIPIVVPVPWFIYLFAMGNEKRVLYPPVACYFYQHLTRSVSEIFYFLSTWLNVLLAVQDYLTACMPHLAKRYCQLRVVVMQIVTCTLLAFLLNLPQALKLVFKPVKFYYNNELTWGCKALQARWFKDLIGEYVALYDDIFAAIIVIFVDGGPAALLITLTALLIRQLQRQRIKGHLLMEQARTASKRRRERYRQQEYESSARVMIFVLLASLAVKIPFATTYSMMIIQSRFDIHFVENLVDFQSAITITDLAFVLSYPINFTIFCCCSKKFRHKCVQLLGECTHNTKTTRNRLMSSFSMSLNNSTTSQIYKRPSSISSTVASQTHQQQQQQQQDGTATLNGLSLTDKDMVDSETWLEPFRQQRGDNENNPLIMNIGGSLDERRPLVLERLCDGRHHLEWLHPGDRPPHFRALLADGSQCQECLARHEDLWASCGQQQRRFSSDSSQANWPMPPPLPPLHLAQHYGGGQRSLPQIVTTRCESIREQPSWDEANGDKVPGGDGNLVEDDGGGGDDGDDDVDDREEQQRQVQTAVDTDDEVTASSATNTSSQQQQHQFRRGEKQTQESLQEQIDRHERRQQQQQQVHGDEEDEGHLLRIGSRSSGSKGNQLGVHGGSDPGSSSSFMSIKYLKGFVLRRLSGGSQEDHNSCRGDYTGGASGKRTAADGDAGPATAAGADGGGGGSHFREHMDDKHSSLSLSNSKLSTLPSATVQLADTLMSTLFIGPSGRSGGGGGGGKSNNQASSSSSRSANLRGSGGQRTRNSRGSRRSHG